MSGYDETNDLPDGLQDFLKGTIGMELPEGNESGLRSISQALIQYADTCRDAADRLDSLSGDIDDVLDGEFAQEVVDKLGTTSPEALRGQEQSARDLGSQAKDAAADIEKTRIMFIAMTIMVAAEVAYLLSTLILAPLAGAVIATARGVMHLGLQQLIKQIASRTASVVSKIPTALRGASTQGVAKEIGKRAWTTAKYAAGGAAFGTAFMAGMDGGIQLDQKNKGTRDKINKESIKGSAIGGAIGGGAAGAAAGAARSVAVRAEAKLSQGPREFNKKIDSFNSQHGTNFAKVPERPNAKSVREFNKKIDDFNSQHGTNFAKKQEGADWPPGMRKLGGMADASLQMLSVPASNPLVYLATDDHHGGAADGMFGAFARGGAGGRTGGASGEASSRADASAQAALDATNAVTQDGKLKIPEV
ncbi:MAG: hypothetical protein IJH84_25715, partial [Saccharopolyspora sp.]|uniref:WXG100-like domain-containing protein n=1 Tax=Saccharopolyspora sp. TaxID=33915 RepID=UPI0025D8CB15